MQIQSYHALSLLRMFEMGRVSVGFISELSNIQPERSSEAAEAGRAIIVAMKGIAPLDTEGWILLCRLLNSSRFYREDIRTELHVLFASRPQVTEARVVVLATLLNMGYRFTPKELEAEEEIEHEYPWIWDSVWERSGLTTYKPKK